MFFGLQETRDSLKRAFESLFDKYDQEFDDDDEIDILSLKVVKKSNKKSSVVQKPRKFGFLYRKEGEQISEEENEEQDDNVSDVDDIDDEEESLEDGTATPSNLEKIINERSNILFSATASRSFEQLNFVKEKKKPRKIQKKRAQLKFDLAVLRLLELEMSAKLKGCLPTCPHHQEDINRDCFECSLINIIP